MATSLGSVESASWAENSVFQVIAGQVLLTDQATSDVGTLIYTAGTVPTEGVLKVQCEMVGNVSGTLSVGYIDSAASTSTSTSLAALASFYGASDNPNSSGQVVFAGTGTALAHWITPQGSVWDVYVSYCISAGVLTIKVYKCPPGVLPATAYLVNRLTGTAPSYSTAHPCVGCSNGGSFPTQGIVQGTPTFETAPAAYPIQNIYAYELSTSVMVTWDEHPLANSYDVRVNGGTPFSVANSTAPETTITSLTNGTTYTIEVRPVAQSGVGAWQSITAKPSTVLHWDKFTHADSASAIGTPDVGGPYTVQAGTWGISSNQGYQAVSTSKGHVTAPGAADIDITCTLPANISTLHGILFRWQDASNYWILTANTTGGVLTLQKSVAAVLSSPVTFGYAVQPKDKLRVIAKGRQMWFYANGMPIGYFESGLFQTSTPFGLYVNTGITARFDNLLAKAAPTDPTLGRDPTVGWLNTGGITKDLDIAGAA